MNEADFLFALLVFIVPMCFTPGPNNLLCAAHGSQHGFRATIPMTLGMLVGWSSLGVAVGLGIVYIEENQEIFKVLTWVGAGIHSLPRLERCDLRTKIGRIRGNGTTRLQNRDLFYKLSMAKHGYISL